MNDLDISTAVREEVRRETRVILGTLEGTLDRIDRKVSSMDDATRAEEKKYAADRVRLDHQVQGLGRLETRVGDLETGLSDLKETMAAHNRTIAIFGTLGVLVGSGIVSLIVSLLTSGT